MSAHNLMDRLQALMVEYPALGLVGSFVALNQGFFMSEATLAALCLGFLGLAACVHWYDLARKRVQQQARRLGGGLEIRPNFCFASAELQESFERCRRRAVLWRALDWGAVLFLPVLAIKLAGKSECGALGYQLWPLSILSACLPRLLYRDRLSTGTYSLVSLVVTTLIWVNHCCMLLRGDLCFGALWRRRVFLGPKHPVLAMFGFTALTITNALNPVSQAYVPLKLILTATGSVCGCYMQLLFRDGTIRTEADPEGWGLYWLCVGIGASCMATFHANTMLVEEGMMRYMTVVMMRSRRSGD
eukprot:CAMPEP_0177766898 /NCGR_PEP_ID=MMETSP0491_2-20121128/8772_1 /TAXON_ID=63592 /ORGANISM="Tetraselmis chuii, Strain PLY429" /LENGTH=301 /DNA_ID=CAMNT_0019283347 /DNA_START=145 /DNA_END=1050 /DNA_ORIENTATION=+